MRVIYIFTKIIPFTFFRNYCYNKNLAIANRSRVSCQRNHWIDDTRLTISRVIWRWILWWLWNVG